MEPAPGQWARPAEPSEGSPKKVNVLGFPIYTQPRDLTHIFSNYGAVEVEKLGNQFATLNFSKVSEANAAIQASKKIMIYGNLLTVKPYARMEDKYKNKRVKVNNKYDEVIVKPEELDYNGTFLEQLDRVLAAVRLTQEEVRAVGQLFDDVEAALVQLWPDCKAIPFGSVTTGLGIKTSDADCFISIPKLYRLPDANYVIKAKKVLMKYPNIFTEIVTIPNANTPIVKFFHLPTKFNCDLSFKTTLGVQNSKLIAFLLHADPRIIPMAVFIKYWGKVSNFTGRGKLTNYALTMLIIFYLQQPPVSMVPSVEWLQRNPEHELIVDNWNVGFMNDYDMLPRSTNTLSIAELLGGFFQYYSTFDFKDSVVCPFLGRPLKKDDFKNFEELPNEFERYKRNIRDHNSPGLRFTTSVCVQDPLELCHNVASPVSLRYAEEMEVFLKFAAEAYDKSKHSNNDGFLKAILLERPIILKKGSPVYRAFLGSDVIHRITEHDWPTVVRDIVLKIFEQIFKINLVTKEDPKEDDPQRLREKYSGTIIKAIWKRRQFQKLYNMTMMGFLEKQTRITDEILLADNNVININFELALICHFRSKSSAVSIKLIDGDLNQFKEFTAFYLSVFKSWFSILMEPYVTPSRQNKGNFQINPNKNADGNLNKVVSSDVRSSAKDAEDNDEDVKQESGVISGNHKENSN